MFHLFYSKTLKSSQNVAYNVYNKHPCNKIVVEYIIYLGFLQIIINYNVVILELFRVSEKLVCNLGLSYV